MAAAGYGHLWEVELVHCQLVRADPDAPDPSAPVLVLEGAAGVGKTTLLRALDTSCAGQVPRAYVDLADQVTDPGEDTVLALLYTLARLLSRECGDYGRLCFERVALGLFAVAAPLDHRDVEAGRRQLEDLLTGRNPLIRTKKVLAELVNTAAGLAGLDAPTLAEEAVTWAVDIVAPRLPGRRRSALRRARDFYGRQDAGSAVDVLFELHWALRSEARTASYRLLWQALLTDLGDEFRRGRWTGKVLVLLDNADCPLGLRFLREVVRPENGPRQPAGQPMTIVTTSRGGLLAGLPLRRQRAVVPVLDTGRPAPLAPGEWARRILPGLREQHLRALVGRASSEQDTANVAQQLLELTGGQPAAAALIRRQLPAERVSPFDPEKLLGTAYGAGSLEQHLLDDLQRGVPEEDRAALATAALARTEVEAVRLLRNHVEWAHVRLPVAMWEPSCGASTTLLRLLLQRRVMIRSDEPWTWDDTHRHLAEKGDGDSRLYHLLALGEIESVVSALCDPMPRPANGEAWLRRFDEVIRAPRRTPGAPAAEPAAEPVAGGVEPVGPDLVRALLLIGWAVRDPLLGPGRSALYRRYAVAYQGLARELDQSSEEVADRVRHYQELALRWQHRTRRPPSN